MKTFSLAMIVRDEAQVLAHCLNSLAPIADEIVIVDTGSRDATKQVAARYTKKLYDFPWRDDFAAARNFMMAQASCDYVLLADADELFSDTATAELAALKSTLCDENAVITQYEDARNGFVSPRVRLLRRNANFVWNHPIHERVNLREPILYSDILIRHPKSRAGLSSNRIAILRNMLDSGYPFDLELALNCWLDAYRAKDAPLARELLRVCALCAKRTEDTSIVLFFAEILLKAGDPPMALALLTRTGCGDTTLARLLRLQSSLGGKQQ
jgi:glycosyltransferase involved in cell wall biosynthesis